jgi:hypothetical protein
MIIIILVVFGYAQMSEWVKLDYCYGFYLILRFTSCAQAWYDIEKLFSKFTK